MGRPRKIGRRKPCGRLIQEKKPDPRAETAQTRIRDFGVTEVQSLTPLAGYLAGVMYLRGLIESRHLGHFFSFLQMVPVPMGAIKYGVRVTGGGEAGFKPMTAHFYLARRLGADISLLHELANDRLICTVDKLKSILRKVPLTAGGSAYINWCETHHPKTRSRNGTDSTKQDGKSKAD